MNPESNQEGLSALEKARLLKQQRAEEKAREEALRIEEENKKVLETQSTIEELAQKIEELNAQKEELVKLAEEHRGKRKETISSIRGAMKELTTDEDSRELLEDEETKQGILGGDTEKLEYEKSLEKETKNKIKEIEKEIADIESQIKELQAETPEGKEAIDQEKIQELEEKIPIEVYEYPIYHKLFKEIRLSDYKKLDADEQMLLPKIVLEKVNGAIDAKFEKDLVRAGLTPEIKGRQKVEDFLEGKQRALKNIRELRSYYEEVVAEIEGLYKEALLINKNIAPTDDHKEKAARLVQELQSWEVGKARTDFHFGDLDTFNSIERSLEGAHRESLESGEAAYPPDIVNTYVENVKEALAARKELLENIVSYLKNPDTQDFEKLLIPFNFRGGYKNGVSGISSEARPYKYEIANLKMSDEEFRKKYNEIEGEHKSYKELAGIQVEKDFLNLRHGNDLVHILRKESAGRDDLKKLESITTLIKKLEIKNDARIQEDVVFGGGRVFFKGAADDMVRIRAEIKTLEQEKIKLEEDQKTALREGPAKNFIGVISKSSKEAHDVKMEEIKTNIEAKTAEITNKKRRMVEADDLTYVTTDKSETEILAQFVTDSTQEKKLGEFFEQMHKDISDRINQVELPSEEEVAAAKHWSELIDKERKLLNMLQK